MNHPKNNSRGLAYHCQDVAFVCHTLDHVLAHQVSLSHHLDRKQVTCNQS
jgi:hypothetical protein